MKILYFLLSLSLIVFSACQMEESEILANYELVYHNSFESEQELSDLDIIGGKLISDASPSGGEKCLSIEPQWLPQEGFFAKDFVFLEEENEHLISFQYKVQNGLGYIYLYKISEGEEQLFFQHELNQEDWTEFNIDLNPGIISESTIRCKISAGSTEVANWQVLVDELSLRKLTE